ncbi:TIR domain-containing protein [Saccharothrix xinjiangensis]|uniref:TIR domain-containing protein n=1 Tax=Saccharothrix xinjiangensis TaxID=204798 RepID=A0ABV9XRU4_9PSEU
MTVDGVFVSYRTGDGDWAATLVARELESRFGADRVFLASRTIRPGDDFTEQIDRWLDRSDVVLVVIGPRWLTASNGRGRRLDEPGDWVRYEVATALASGVRVIPVLLDGAEPPAEADLPPGTEALARSHVLRLRHGNDDRDIARLVDELAALAPEVRPARRPPGFRPYRGLETFREEDAALFHGRDREAARLRELVAAHPVVVVAGASGSGKSSLVRAALVPRLRAEGAEVGVFRPVVDTRPVAALLGAVRAAVGADLADRLDPDDVRLWADPLAAGVGRLVLVVDQFEELVAAAPDQAAELFDLAVALTRAAPARPGGPPALGVVCTVRGTDVDALPAGELARALETSGVFVPRMGPAELRAAVEAPVAGAAAFEAGLVERIVRDAGDAPGQLALVQFALTRLWETAGGGVLAHEAYDRVGGVAGALAGYADELLARPPWPDDLPLVERLLVQLARPVDSGGFAASPARLDRFEPELRAVAARLSANRLVVIRQDPGQPEVVALAHEALLHAWPPLRSWLVAARDFRAWQERLRGAVDQWLDAERDPAALPGGVPLARAEEWLATHGDRMAEVEREYVAAGRERREAVRRASATRVRWQRRLLVVLAVLTIVASASATFAVRANRQLDAQLRTQDARVMGQEAQRRAGGDPAVALRLALTSWHTDRDVPEAYAALLQQRLRLGQAVRLHPDQWDGAPTDWLSSADGAVTAALATTTGGEPGLRVWPGALDGAPGSWQVDDVPGVTAAALDSDGGRLAAVGDDRRIRLWDVASRTRQAVLDPGDGPPASDSRDVLRFSPDGSRLLHVHETGSDGGGRRVAIRVWDVERGEPVPARATGLPPRWSDFWLGADGRSLVVAQPFGTGEVIVFDLETGRERRRFEDAAVVGRGASVLTCAGDALRVVDAATGTTLRDIDRRHCHLPGLAVDTTGRYAVESHRAGDPNGYDVLVLLDLATGGRYSVTAPGRDAEDAGRLTTVPRSDGSALVAMPVGTAVVALRATTAEPRAGLTFAAGTPVGDGVHEVRVTGDEVVLLDAGGREVARQVAPHLLDPALVNGSSVPAPTADGSRLVFTASGHVAVYSVPDLAVVRTFRVPSPADPDRPCDQARWGADVFSTAAREVTVVCEGVLTRWRTDSGGPLEEPLDLGERARGERDNTVRVRPRPGRPDEVLALPDRRRLEVWDTRTRTRAASVDLGLPVSGTGTTSLVPDAGGGRVAVHHEGGTITLRDLDAGGATVLGFPPRAPVRGVLGFGPDDTLLVLLDLPDANAIQVRDVSPGAEDSVLAVVHPPGASTWRLDGDRLATEWADSLLTLDPAGWYRDLCALPGREPVADAPTNGREGGLCS